MTSRNYTEYSGPAEWLRETYPPLHAVWTQSFSSQDPSMMNFELKCKICELKPSSGVHYGVKMCEADKQFLKRTFHYQIVYSDCSKKDLAVCPPRPRGWCQICRLRKCLSLPVNINLIRIGNKTNKNKVKEEPPQISITVIPPPVVEQTEFPSLDYNIKTLPSLDFFQYREPALISDFQTDFSQPLDLSVKRRETPVADTDWFSDELLFTAFPEPGHVFLPPNKPLDLSPYCSTAAADLTEFLLAPASDPVARRTPSPVLDASQSFYKLSVNSTLLGDALSRIQSNISMSNSLVNLSSVSDILTENDK